MRLLPHVRLSLDLTVAMSLDVSDSSTEEQARAAAAGLAPEIAHRAGCIVSDALTAAAAEGLVVRGKVRIGDAETEIR